MSDDSRQVLPIMLGTAGHVDHGKTSLVRKLTTFDTDTHKEERERGVSIDFGVAPLEVGENQVCGIIDVPGHIDFIRNMVAGASAVDLLMLVVAADDGVMPQTIEHMQIASILGLKRVICVLTKCDLVDEETIELAEMEVREFLQSLGYKDTPLHRVSSETGAGIKELNAALVEQVHTTPDSNIAKPFRMFVRKAFTMKGFGTVVTGVPLSGVAKEGESLELIPGEAQYRIRAIHNYRSSVSQAQAHVSCALNMRDVAPDEFSRGMALVTPTSFGAMRTLLVEFNNVSKQKVERKKKDQIIRLHVGTAAVAARVVGSVPAGEKGFLELHAAKPIVVSPGDRLLLRTLSTSITLGGGLLIAAEQQPRAKLLNADRNQKALAALNDGDLLSAYFYSAIRPIVSPAGARSYCQIPELEAEKLLKKRSSKGELVALDGSKYLVKERLAEIVAETDAILKRYHRGNQESLGMREQHLCEVLGLPKNSFGRLWQHLQHESELCFEKTFVSRKDFKPSISKNEIEQQEKLFALLQSDPGVSVSKGRVQEALGLVDKDYRKLSKRLADSGRISVIGNSLISRERLEEIQNTMIRLFETEAVLELKSFRDSLGLGRNAAVEILEHFDSRGITKRQGSGRILAQKPKDSPK